MHIKNRIMKNDNKVYISETCDNDHTAFENANVNDIIIPVNVPDSLEI